MLRACLRYNWCVINLRLRSDLRRAASRVTASRKSSRVDQMAFAVREVRAGKSKETGDARVRFGALRASYLGAT